jgi:hypothetical protein
VGTLARCFFSTNIACGEERLKEKLCRLLLVLQKLRAQPCTQLVHRRVLHSLKQLAKWRKACFFGYFTQRGDGEQIFLRFSLLLRASWPGFRLWSKHQPLQSKISWNLPDRELGTSKGEIV